MDEPSQFASLSPSLLARKGAARPAMRPQIQPLRQFREATARQIDEDLGWNDIDGEDAESAERPAGEVVAFNPAAMEHTGEVPDVVRQQENLAARIPETSRPRRPSGTALAMGGRSAFTLRLDLERHLKLRLACTIANRSAQQLVIEALDRLIAELPDVASLAAQLGKRR